MKFRKGDIVELDLNKVSVNLGKNIQFLKRPQVIISNNINNKGHSPIVNIAAMSKQISKEKYPMHIKLLKKKYGLEYDSLIYCEQVLTVNKDCIKRIIGHLDADDIKILINSLAVQLIL